MRFIPTDVSDVVIVEPQIFGDDRGFFMESWRQDSFFEAGIDAEFVQENHSRSAKGVLRGLHYQIRSAQGKLVRVVYGEVYDVAVDMRKSSATFGRWVGTYLSAEDRRQIWVPPGFAHGFLVVSDSADLVYKCTELYAPMEERVLLWNDSDLGIEWPISAGNEPILSKKDSDGVRFELADCYP